MPTIRFYENIGLIARLGRSEGGQHRYDEPAMRRLGFVRHAREMEVSLDAIRQRLALVDQPVASWEPIDGIVRKQIEEVNRRIGILSAIRESPIRVVWLNPERDEVRKLELA